MYIYPVCYVTRDSVWNYLDVTKEDLDPEADFFDENGEVKVEKLNEFCDEDIETGHPLEVLKVRVWEGEGEIPQAVDLDHVVTVVRNQVQFLLGGFVVDADALAFALDVLGTRNIYSEVPEVPLLGIIDRVASTWPRSTFKDPEAHDRMVKNYVEEFSKKIAPPHTGGDDLHELHLVTREGAVTSLSIDPRWNAELVQAHESLKRIIVETSPKLMDVTMPVDADVEAYPVDLYAMEGLDGESGQIKYRREAYHIYANMLYDTLRRLWDDIDPTTGDAVLSIEDTFKANPSQFNEIGGDGRPVSNILRESEHSTTVWSMYAGDSKKHLSIFIHLNCRCGDLGDILSIF